jgi:hypothetical protein
MCKKEGCGDLNLGLWGKRDGSPPLHKMISCVFKAFLILFEPDQTGGSTGWTNQTMSRGLKRLDVRSGPNNFVYD